MTQKIGSLPQTDHVSFAYLFGNGMVLRPLLNVSAENGLWKLEHNNSAVLICILFV